VDKDFAATKASGEQLFGIDVPLKQILDTKVASKTREQTLKFILDLYGEARERLLENLREGSGCSFKSALPLLLTLL
jgi:hypothetical protein